MVGPSQLAPGVVFARSFRILSALAEGGMGSVYVAEQLATGKRRALKVMLPDLVSDPRARQRFELEAKIAAQIESEHVVEVVGAGVDDQTGTPWLAMELLEGRDLGKLVRDVGRIPASDVLVYFQQMGHALGIAHARGIIHRDLKPENLFLAQTRRIGAGAAPFTLKVLDFGIAKLVQESGTASHRTAAMGSPLWMAPEQTEQAMLTPRTDVWAMGLIAFYLLTGRVYWRSANQEETRLASVLTELLVSPLDPPSVRAAQLGVTEPLPAGFDAWFARCVARDVAHRWSSASEAVSVLGPSMSYRGARGDASQPVTHERPAYAAPRIAPTVALDVYPSASPSHPGAWSAPGAVAAGHPSHPPPSQPGYASQPGAYVSQPGGYASQPGAYASQPGSASGVMVGATAGPASGFSIGRLLAYTTAFVLALSCAGGTTFGALHAWQTYGPGSGRPPPAPTPIPVAVVDAGSPFMVAVPPTLDTPTDAGTPTVVAERRETPPGREAPSELPEGTARELDWPDGDAHVFRGTGRFESGIVCDFTLTLNRNGPTIDGLFHWTVREVPPAASGSAHVGQTLDEPVTGSWAAPACNLHTVGGASSTNVRLRIAGDGRLSGRDDDGTRYSGRLAR